MHVDVHGCVHSSAQVVLSVILFAVDDLNLKGSAWHGEDWTVVKVGAELLPI